MKFAKFVIAVVLFVLGASGPGCSTFKKLKLTSKKTVPSTPADPAEVATETVTMNSTEKRVSLLQARASLAEMDQLPVEAIQSYEAILEIDPENVVALHRIGLLHVQQNDYEKAEAKFRAALRSAPENALVLNDYGYFCHLQNRPAEAISHLARALEINPNYLAAHNNLGLVLAGEGQQEEAELHFRMAKCDQAETLNNLALARFMKSDLAQAASLYHQALKIDPNHERARSSLGSLNRIASQSQSPTEESRSHTYVAPAGFNDLEQSLLE